MVAELHRGYSLVSSAECGTTVGASSLTQGPTEQNSQGEEEDGTQDSQTGEVILQHADSASRTSADHHHRGLDDGIRAGYVRLSRYRSGLRGIRLSCRIWVRWRLGGEGCSSSGSSRWNGPVSRLWLRAVVVCSPGDSVVSWRSVLEQRLVVHV